LFAEGVRPSVENSHSRERTSRPYFEEPNPCEKSLPPGLCPFCLYEHPEAGGELTLAELPELAAIERDCMSVLPAASSLVGAAYPDLQRRFLFQAAGIVDFPPQARAGSPAVRLALLDTAPTSVNPAANANNRSPHGYTLANMAKRLGCTAAGLCTAEVTSQLALPWVVYEPTSRALSVRDDVRGGFVGMIGELAEAIRAAVVAWQAAGSRQHLVLNLSVGWNPQFGGLEANVTDMPVAVQAVHAAFEDAACRGVAAVAAAGNLTWGPEVGPSNGPILPAAWERRGVPSEAQCAAALEPGATVGLDDESSSSYRPLVYAMGAVNADNSRLGKARFRAEPRLVAFGDHGVVVGEADGKATAVLTGSSVSTLVTATALAWVESYRPGLDVFEAVDQVYQDRPLVERRAEVCLGAPVGEPCSSGTAQPVRRVVVGQAAFAACKACEGPGCPKPCLEWKGEKPPGLAPSAYEGFASSQTVPLAEVAAASSSTHGACPPEEWRRALRAAGRQSGPERFHGAGAAALQRCPHWQLYDTSFYAVTGTQPGSEPCPSCGFGGGGGTGSSGSTGLLSSPAWAQAGAPPPAADTLYLEVDEDYVGELSWPVLKVGDQTYALDAVWPDLAPGSKLKITGISVGPNDTLQLSFVVNGERSTTSLFLRPD
jgi:hypothetical protein